MNDLDNQVDYYGQKQAEDAMSVIASWIAESGKCKIIYHNGTAVDAKFEKGRPTGEIRIPRLSCATGLTQEALLMLRSCVYHEAGHVVDSDLSKVEWPKGALFLIWNGLEDVRMEKKQAKKYLGCESVFAESAQHCNKKIARKINDGEIDAPLWEAIVAMGFMVKGLELAWRLTPKAKAYVDVSYSEFSKIAQARDSYDALAIAKKVFDLLKKENDDWKKEKDKQDNQDKQDTQDKQDNQDNQDNQDGEGQDGEGQDGEGQDGEGQEGKGQGKEGKEKKEGKGSEQEDKPQSSGAKDFDDYENESKNGKGEEKSDKPEKNGKPEKSEKAQDSSEKDGKDGEGSDKGGKKEEKQDGSKDGSDGSKESEDGDADADADAGEEKKDGNGKSQSDESDINADENSDSDTDGDSDGDADGDSDSDSDTDGDTDGGDDSKDGDSGNSDGSEGNEEAGKDGTETMPSNSSIGGDADEASEEKDVVDKDDGSDNGGKIMPCGKYDPNKDEEPVGGRGDGKDGRDLENEIDGPTTNEMLNEELEEFFNNMPEEDKAYLSVRASDSHVYPATKEDDKITYRERLSQVSSTVASMTRAMEQALMAMARCRKNSHLESGRVDLDRLVHIAKSLSKEVFFDSQNGKKLNVAVAITIDESGSMDNFYDVQLLAMAIGEALNAINVPFEIIGSTTKYSIGDYHMPAMNGFSRVNPIVYKHYKDFADKWVAVRQRIIHSYHYDHNVDGEVVEYAAFRLAQRKEARKVVFSLSDGSPCAGHGNNRQMGVNLKRVCERTRKNGIEVYGFGIGTDSPRAYYGDKFFVALADVKAMGCDFVREFVKIVTLGKVHV